MRKQRGWDKTTNLYGRAGPTRTLLGEEQFTWLQANYPHRCIYYHLPYKLKQFVHHLDWQLEELRPL